MKQTPHGFIRVEEGQIVEISPVSALSGEKLGAGSYTVPIPGRPDLRARITASEKMRMTPALMERLVAKAADLYPAPEPDRKSKRSTLDQSLDSERGEDAHG